MWREFVWERQSSLTTSGMQQQVGILSEYFAMRTESLLLLSRKKMRRGDSNKSCKKREETNLRRMPDEKERRIALIKDKAGKKSVPRDEKHEQETDRRTNRHSQCPGVSILPVIRAADHKRG